MNTYLLKQNGPKFQTLDPKIYTSIFNFRNIVATLGNILTPATLNKWYFVIKIVLTYCEKNCSSVREKNLKFKAEGREFVKILRSLEQFIQTVKGQNNFW